MQMTPGAGKHKQGSEKQTAVYFITFSLHVYKGRKQSGTNYYCQGQFIKVLRKHIARD
jgi:hypothetical protein